MSPARQTIAVPRFALVVLMGPSGAARKEFAWKWFPRGSIVSVDRCREMVADDSSADSASAEALALLETWVAARTRLGRLTVVDTPGFDPRFRARMLELARQYHAPAFLIAIDLDAEPARERGRSGAKQSSRWRRGRQYRRFRKALERAGAEGWNRAVTVNGRLAGVEVAIRPLRVECDVPPPYDLIGDIHGCYQELRDLLEKLGYRKDPVQGYRHPRGRRVIFVGDLVDRGPDSLSVLQLAMTMKRAGNALVTLGNHDNKLLNYLVGGRVRIDHGLELTVAELEAVDPGARKALVQDITAWLRGLPPYLMLDQGRLVVAHAGLPEHLHGRLSRVVTACAVYGAVRPVWHHDRPGGETDWPASYHGKALVVFGHTPTPLVETRGNTVCVDQGCVFGGKLTALRYPERQVVQVDARDTYYPDDAPDLEVVSNGTNGADNGEHHDVHDEAHNETPPEIAPVAPCLDPDVDQGPSAQAASSPPAPVTAPSATSANADGGARQPGASGNPGIAALLPDLGPLLRGGTLTTAWLGPVKVRSQQIPVALDLIAKGNVDPRWLVFIPPPILPSASSTRKDHVDHLEEVLRHYRDSGLPLMVEEMHLGKRVVIALGRDDDICAERLGVRAPGVIYDTIGVAPLAGHLLETTIDRLRGVLEASGAFERLSARLLIIDAALLPWNLGNLDYVARQCLPAATALLASRARAIEALDGAIERGVPVRHLRDAALCDHDAARRTLHLLQQHVRSVGGPEDVRLVPHQVLATDTRTLFDKDRAWQWAEIERWMGGADVLFPSRRVQVTWKGDEDAALALWEEISSSGGGGVVVRTMDWFPSPRGRPELPAVKVRGRETLRLELGPLYLSPDHISRSKGRALHARQATAIRNWALASEGLERFARGEPFSAYHPYALAVLAARASAIKRPRR